MSSSTKLSSWVMVKPCSVAQYSDEADRNGLPIAAGLCLVAPVMRPYGSRGRTGPRCLLGIAGGAILDCIPAAGENVGVREFDMTDPVPRELVEVSRDRDWARRPMFEDVTVSVFCESSCADGAAHFGFQGCFGGSNMFRSSSVKSKLPELPELF
jgi:hypothetical protein